MSFFTKVNDATKRVKSGLRSMADRQIAKTEAQTRKRLALAKTQTEKLRIKAQADREKARVYRELAEAQRAAEKASKAVKVAKREAGDIPATEKLRRGITGFRKGLRDFQREVNSLQGSSGKRTKRKRAGVRTTAKKRKAGTTRRR